MGYKRCGLLEIKNLVEEDFGTFIDVIHMVVELDLVYCKILKTHQDNIMLLHYKHTSPQ